jgi:hypothetical protein
MGEIRQATILVRDRQTTGGALPSGALMAEPFVNLYDGILKFSGVTGGVYEPSDVSSVFEVGSTLYNSKITNRLNINDNFIISGDTGIISTYGATSGAGLVGKFLSGVTGGFVLGDISDISGISDITRVQGGTNIITGGTANEPTVNLVDSPSINGLTASGTSNFTGVIQSGGTDLGDIFLTSGDISGSTVSAGTNISVNNVGVDYEVSVIDSPSFNDITFSGTATGGNVFATELSGGTIYSGSTDLYSIFQQVGADTDHTAVQGGTNITTGGTASAPVINVIDSPVFTGLVSATGFTDSSLTAGRVTYAGVGGRLTDEAGFEYDAGANLLKTANIQIGDPTTTGDTTTTIFGNVIIVGDAFSAITSELYIEDNFIELNFNPTASTASTSLGAGWSIQDGSGVDTIDAFFDIRGAATGLLNRSFATNLGNIRVAETGSVSSPNGLFVIKESDIIDGGSY